MLFGASMHLTGIVFAFQDALALVVGTCWRVVLVGHWFNWHNSKHSMCHVPFYLSFDWHRVIFVIFTDVVSLSTFTSK